jgi:hypothetical protein
MNNNDAAPIIALTPEEASTLCARRVLQTRKVHDPRIAWDVSSIDLEGRSIIFWTRSGASQFFCEKVHNPIGFAGRTIRTRKKGVDTFYTVISADVTRAESGMWVLSATLERKTSTPLDESV